MGSTLSEVQALLHLHLCSLANLFSKLKIQQNLLLFCVVSGSQRLLTNQIAFICTCRTGRNVV
jgi:hypothetical protein